MPDLLLTVVVPVYNGGEDILENVAAIERAVAAGIPRERVELVVVSDGSIDDTAERLLDARTSDIRVIHYDRNLGKGYAVKVGALAAHGEWVALVDSDLDLDPASIPAFLKVAREEDLDFAIGSKRHPDSIVRYPRSRRVASWSYQQLNRVLFRLDVRDTQVGLKLFNRRVVDEVIPLLLVKQFAFDLELLAVATALGFGRIEELPVRLEYRFTGSALGSRAVVRALWDTAAIFYRLRILHTYQRKQGLLVSRTRELPLVSVIGSDALRRLDYPRTEHPDDARSASGELVAVLASGARPGGNWITAAVPFFADQEVAAVVTPSVASARGSLRERAAGAVRESRLGGGSRRSTFFPGNVRVVTDYPADTVVARRTDYVAALDAGVGVEEFVSWLASRGRRTVYTPDASVTLAPAPLVLPHLSSTFRHGAARAHAARRTRGRSLSGATALSLAPALAAFVGLVLLIVGRSVRTVGLVLVVTYGAALVVNALHAAIRFRSLAVGVVAPLAVVASQIAYLSGFVRGLFRR